MKWSWKSFFIGLVAVFVAALAVSYGISQIIDFGATSDAEATRRSHLPSCPAGEPGTSKCFL